MLYQLARLAWLSGRATLWVLTAVLSFRPSLLEAIGMADSAIAWLIQPWVLMPLTTVVTVLACFDIALLWAKRRAARVATQLPIADTPLRDAFSYLRFRSRWAMQFNNSHDCAIAASKEIEDQMSMDRLKVWGRDKSFTFSSLKEIDHSFWNGMNLSAMSLWTTQADESAESKRANYQGSHGLVQFKDLRIDRVQMMQVWPPAPRHLWPILKKRMLNPGVDYSARQRSLRRMKRRTKALAITNGTKARLKLCFQRVLGRIGA